jgi:hypothetical protein
MEIGLLWYDDDPRRDLEDKVRQAALRYRAKYGRWPNTCYVHPQAVTDQMEQELRVPCPKRQRIVIRVVSAPNILPHHYWLGETTVESGRCFAKAAA